MQAHMQFAVSERMLSVSQDPYESCINTDTKWSFLFQDFWWCISLSSYTCAIESIGSTVVWWWGGGLETRITLTYEQYDGNKQLL